MINWHVAGTNGTMTERENEVKKFSCAEIGYGYWVFQWLLGAIIGILIGKPYGYDVGMSAITGFLLLGFFGIAPLILIWWPLVAIWDALSQHSPWRGLLNLLPCFLAEKISRVVWAVLVGAVDAGWAAMLIFCNRPIDSRLFLPTCVTVFLTHAVVGWVAFYLVEERCTGQVYREYD